MTNYYVHIMDKAARMPSSVQHPYRYCAVVISETPSKPSMISMRARGMKEIVWSSPPSNVGKCIRSAFARALNEADIYYEYATLGLSYGVYKYDE